MKTRKHKEALFENLILTLAKIMVNINYGEHYRPTGWPKKNVLPETNDILGLELSVHISDASRKVLDLLIDADVAFETSSTSARIHQNLKHWPNAYLQNIETLQIPLDKAINAFLELCGCYIEPYVELHTVTFQPPDIYKPIFDCFVACGYAQRSALGLYWTDKMGPRFVSQRIWRFEKRNQQIRHEEEGARKVKRKIALMAATIPKSISQRLLKEPESHHPLLLAALLAKHWDGTEWRSDTDLHSISRFAMFSANGDSKRLLKEIKKKTKVD